MGSSLRRWLDGIWFYAQGPRGHMRGFVLFLVLVTVGWRWAELHSEAKARAQRWAASSVQDAFPKSGRDQARQGNALLETSVNRTTRQVFEAQKGTDGGNIGQRWLSGSTHLQSRLDLLKTLCARLESGDCDALLHELQGVLRAWVEPHNLAQWVSSRR